MASGIPIFTLYGEQEPWSTPDMLHFESIAQRSSLHDWEIKPHRHGDLFQLFYVWRGQAELDIEGRISRVQGGVLQWVPPLCVHGFRFSPDVDGGVLTLAAPLVGQFERALNQPLAFGNRPQCLDMGEDRDFLQHLFGALAREYHYHSPGRQLALSAWVNLLLTWLQRRTLDRDQGEPVSGGDQVFLRFTRLVEQHYARQWPVQKYAEQLGISVVRLNVVCRRLGRQSALQFIHQRLLLEAKRNLVYTAMTVSQVSDSLGFSEPAYFSRFFRRLTGTSPNAFRQAGIAQFTGEPAP
ncbi:helix-turn-helix domain-containing protein [Zobellella taiwanensis]|jgi:AraC family transcriptional activator of pobA